MVAFTVLRQAARANSTRLVAGMRVSLASSSASKVSKMSSNAVNVGVRAFSVSARRFASGTTDIALSQKLKEELKYEKESLSEGSTPEFLKNFLEKGVWSISDVRGNDEVILTRKFGDENIRLIFSISDIQPEEDFEEEEPESDSESDVDENPAPYPVRAALTITKSNGPGSLNVELLCQEGQFVIENISYYDEASLGIDLTAEADWKRRGLYIGPQFDTLDIAVQEEFEKYLRERGINDVVASFIPEYAAHKEQQEYVKWLTKVNTFIQL